MEAKDERPRTDEAPRESAFNRQYRLQRASARRELQVRTDAMMVAHPDREVVGAFKVGRIIEAMLANLLRYGAHSASDLSDGTEEDREFLETCLELAKYELKDVEQLAGVFQDKDVSLLLSALEARAEARAELRGTHLDLAVSMGCIEGTADEAKGDAGVL